MKKPLSPALFEILGPKDKKLGHDLDLSRSRDVIGHVTIGLPIPHFQFMLHCDQALSATLFEILGPKDNWLTILTFVGHETSSFT